MQSRLPLSCCLYAGLSLLVAGCYGPGMYSPYGNRYPRNGYFSGTPYGQPQYLNQYPGSYTVPGGVVLPPNSGDPYTPGAPGSTIITPEDDGWRTDPNGSGLGDDGYGSGSSDLGTGYGADNSGMVPRPRGDEMFEADGTSGAVDSTEPFGSTASVDVSTAAYGQANAISGIKKFGYSRSDYSWLRGIVSPDNEVPRTYNITYSLKPEVGDEYEGNFVLVPDARLAQLRTGDIVEVRGRIDRVTLTPLGKPMYRIDQMRKLTPQE